MLTQNTTHDTTLTQMQMAHTVTYHAFIQLRMNNVRVLEQPSGLPLYVTVHTGLAAGHTHTRNAHTSLLLLLGPASLVACCCVLSIISVISIDYAISRQLLLPLALSLPPPSSHQSIGNWRQDAGQHPTHPYTGVRVPYTHLTQAAAAVSLQDTTDDSAIRALLVSFPSIQPYTSKSIVLYSVSNIFCE